jgi:NAD(P)-dependent dehydrogenase (short-subunit alcohol dehydrogenase family)
VQAVVDRHGRLDAVLANAGVASYGTIRQIDPAAFARVIDVNLTGVFRTLHATLPHLVETGGYALAVSSLAAFTPMAGLAPYAASKAGVEALALATRQEVAHLGVGVGVCHPGWVDTDMVRATEHDLPGFAESRRRLPWPANSTTSVEDCGRAVADGIAARARRVYVPRGVMAAMVARPLTASPLVERLSRRRIAGSVRQLEQQVARLGRSFGRHTVS